MAEIIQLRRDTSANWNSSDPILAQGEMGIELDTSQAKIGDAESTWSELPYWAFGSTGIQGLTGLQGIKGDTGIIGLTGETGILGLQGVTGILGIDGVTGLQGIQGGTGILGLQGSTGIRGVTGIVPISDTFNPMPAVTSTVSLHWSETDDAFYAGVTGAVGKWVQISAGSMRGVTGIRGDSVSLNFSSSAPIGAVATGIMGQATIPFNCEFDSWQLLSDKTCNIEVDFEKTDYASYPSYTNVHGSTGLYIEDNVKNSGTPTWWSNATASAGDIVKATLRGSDATATNISLNIGYKST